jgi:hypothetical protein
LLFGRERIPQPMKANMFETSPWESPTLRACPECGKTFDAGKTRQKYCSEKHSRKARDRQRKRPPTTTAKIIAERGTNRCNGCGYEGPGKRWAFWNDAGQLDYDGFDFTHDPATARILCSKCWAPSLRKRAGERKRCYNKPLPSEVSLSDWKIAEEAEYVRQRGYCYLAVMLSVDFTHTQRTTLTVSWVLQLSSSP